ncbi:MAG TPA: calcium/sodium antiporter [Lacunisphaera sp.]|nr:calcium/sodium antiporter [Lacunisphaera sp.]
MTTDSLLVLLGLVILVRGGDLFVSAAVRTAGFLRVPTIVIGSTLVSLATTTPELAVSIMAGVESEPGLAVGNAVGSCICNIGLILGIGATLRAIPIDPRTIVVPLAAMVAAGLGLFLLTLDLTLSRAHGAVLVVAGAGYFAWDLWRHLRQARRREVAQAAAVEEELAPPAARWAWFATRTGTAVQFGLSTVLVVAGSRLLVTGAIGLAEAVGISPMVIGLTVVAVGTSLPELVTTITSARRAVSELAVGNVIGANLANLTFVVGAAAFLQEVRMDRTMQLFNFPVAWGFMLALAWLALGRKRITRTSGIVLLLGYATFLTALIALGGLLA